VKTGTGTTIANYTTTWYAYDQQGTVAQRFDADGTLTSVYACDAFGNKLAGVKEVYNYNAKSGYYYDSETGFYYCTHRYYDPKNGRWLTEDPIGFEGGLNLYGYCGNGPVGSVDWSGLHDANGQPLNMDDFNMYGAVDGKVTSHTHEEIIKPKVKKRIYMTICTTIWSAETFMWHKKIAYELKGYEVIVRRYPTKGEILNALKYVDGWVTIAHGSSGQIELRDKNDKMYKRSDEHPDWGSGIDGTDIFIALNNIKMSDDNNIAAEQRQCIGQIISTDKQFIIDKKMKILANSQKDPIITKKLDFAVIIACYSLNNTNLKNATVGPNGKFTGLYGLGAPMGPFALDTFLGPEVFPH
jgi:RHS repeat-associated protein